MTRKDAAIIVGNIPIDKGDDCYTIAEYQQAKAMAIKALEQEPCDDAISKQAVVDYLCTHCPDNAECFEDCDDIKNIKSLPLVKPQPKIGKWKREEFPNFTGWFCDKCGRGWRYKFNYCPNCGDKKDGEDDG